MKKKGSKNHTKQPPKKAHKRKYGKEFNWIASAIGVIAIIFVLVPLIAAIVTNHIDTDTDKISPDTEIVGQVKDNTDISSSEKQNEEWMDSFLETADTYNEEMESVDGEIVGTNLKSVKEYRTLAEAQEDMGFSLGFTHSMKCYDFELVRMFCIGEDEWYQGDFEDNTGVYSDLTVKVSVNTSLNQLIMPYNVKNYEYFNTENIRDIKVCFAGDSQACASVAYFNIGYKNYSIYNPDITYDLMRDIVTECINNNLD